MRNPLLLLVVTGVSGFSACSAPPEDANAANEQALNDLPLKIDESALDRTANPCEDFYQFTCGGWIRNTPPPEAYGFKARAWSDERPNAALAEIHAKAAANPRNPENRKIVDFQASCERLNNGRRPGDFAVAMAGELAALHEAAEQGGVGGLLGRGLRSALDAAHYGDFLSFLQPLLQVYPARDRNGDPNTIALNIAPAPPYFFMLDKAAALESVAAEYPTLSDQEKQSLAELIVRIDTVLAKASARDPEGSNYHPIGLEGLKNTMLHVDWTAFLTSFGVPNAERIVLWNQQGLVDIDLLLSQLSAADLEKYLGYKLVTAWSLFEAPPSSDPAAVKEACLKQTASALAGIVEQRFVDTFVGRNDARLAIALAKEVLRTFQRRLETADFLDTATRAEAIAKATAMQISSILEPRDRYSDVDISSTDYIGNELRIYHRFTSSLLSRIDRRPGENHQLAARFFVPNAFYDPSVNRFMILPAIVNDGNFGGMKSPATHNFGGLGWLVGHEITHGFDDYGRHYDGRGADRNWWTSAAEKAFNSRTDCFVQQYEKFVLPDLIDPSTGQPAHVDGKLTLGENIADDGGLRTAYDAAKPYFANTKTNAGFTPEQQYFVAGGQSFCEMVGSDLQLEWLHNDPHSPGKARVNLPMSNFAAFADAFHCPVGSKMRNPNACSLW